jgi:hypothetical protein
MLSDLLHLTKTTKAWRFLHLNCVSIYIYNCYSLNNFLHYKGVHFQASSTIQKKEGEIKQKSQKILNFQQTNKKLVVLNIFS